MVGLICNISISNYNDNNHTNLLLSSELRTIRESSICEIISPVVSPLSSNSPRVLKLPNAKSTPFHSAMVAFSLASISFSFTADIQISYKTSSVCVLIYTFLLITVHHRLNIHILSLCRTPSGRLV